MPVGCNARLRALVTAYAGQPLPSALEPETPHPAHRASSADTAPPRPPGSYLWAALLARIYECFPLLCPRCGNEMRLIAFITEPASATAPALPYLLHLTAMDGGNAIGL